MLRESELAPGLLIGDAVRIGEGATIGGHVVLHAGAEIGAGARIGDHAQLRERVHVGAGATIGSYTRPPSAPRRSCRSTCSATPPRWTSCAGWRRRGAPAPTPRPERVAATSLALPMGPALAGDGVAVTVDAVRAALAAA